MTFGQMIDRVKFTLGMNETVSNDESLLIKAWLNEGVVDIISRTRPHTRVINLTVQPGTAVHDMATTIIALVDIELPGHGFLRRLSREDIRDRAGRAGPRLRLRGAALLVQPHRLASRPSSRRTGSSARRDDRRRRTTPPTRPTVGWPRSSTRLSSTTRSGRRASTSSTRSRARARSGASCTRARTGWAATSPASSGSSLKRVTPQAARRRDLTRNLGSLSPSGSYLGG